MPKKSAAARSGAQRNKPKVQKSIQLVRQSIEEKEPVVEQNVETTSEDDEFPADEERMPTSIPTAVALDSVSEGTKNVVAPLAGAREGAARKKAPVQLATPDTESQEVSAVSSKGTAASRLAARRQAAQKAQQRTSATLITAEHYAYVRRDLVIIAILAFIMFAVIVGLHFVPAIGG